MTEATVSRTRHVTMTGSDLRQWRETNNVTQGELAEWLGIAKNSIGRWERGGALIPPYLRFALDWLAFVKHLESADSMTPDQLDPGYGESPLARLVREAQ